MRAATKAYHAKLSANLVGEISKAEHAHDSPGKGHATKSGSIIMGRALEEIRAIDAGQHCS